eukprot:2652634-Amphidinium_carterae.1
MSQYYCAWWTPPPPCSWHALGICFAYVPCLVCPPGAGVQAAGLWPGRCVHGVLLVYAHGSSHE